MSTELTTTNTSALPDAWTLDQQNLVIRQFGLQEATPTEIEYFFEVARRTGADPLRRQIYAIMRYNKKEKRKVMSIVWGIDWYRKQAALSNDYAGSDRPVYEGKTDDGNPAMCVFTTYKIVQGHRVAFVSEARWAEYAEKGDYGYMGLWKTKPHVMLAKCAEARCLRMGWPEQLAGTYIEEELPSDLITHADNRMSDHQVMVIGALAAAAGQNVNAWQNKARSLPVEAWETTLYAAGEAVEAHTGIPLETVISVAEYPDANAEYIIDALTPESDGAE